MCLTSSASLGSIMSLMSSHADRDFGSGNWSPSRVCALLEFGCLGKGSREVLPLVASGSDPAAIHFGSNVNPNAASSCSGQLRTFVRGIACWHRPDLGRGVPNGHTRYRCRARNELESSGPRRPDRDRAKAEHITPQEYFG